MSLWNKPLAKRTRCREIWLIFAFATVMAACGGPSLVSNAEAGDASSVKSQLESGQDANQSEGGFTPLMAAALENRLVVARLLLDAGADVNKVTDFEGTPLSALAVAVKSGHVEMVRLLLQHGARTDVRYTQGITVVTYATMAGKGDSAGIVHALAEAGADVDAVMGPDKMTELQVAAKLGRVEVARALLAAGANPSVKNANGKTALDLATQQGHSDVAAALRDAGAEAGAGADLPLPPHTGTGCDKMHEVARICWKEARANRCSAPRFKEDTTLSEAEQRMVTSLCDHVCAEFGRGTSWEAYLAKLDCRVVADDAQRQKLKMNVPVAP